MKTVLILASLLIALAGCSKPKPVQTPQQAAVQQKSAQDDVSNMTRFLQLCNSADNGGIAKFDHEYVEFTGRQTRLVPARIQCKNGLAASFEPTE